MTVKYDTTRITEEISDVNRELEKLDRTFARSEVSANNYSTARRALVTKKLWPLQRASLVLHNRNAYGYDKQTITLREANRLVKKYPSGRPMTSAEIERHYGFKYRARKKK